MLRGPKRSKIEFVEPKEEEEGSLKQTSSNKYSALICHG